jgi:hypothetical protein
MKQIRFYLVFILLIGGIFVSCRSHLEFSYDEEGNFWAVDGRTDEPYRCSASLLAAGKHCLVYGEDGLKIPVSFAETVADKFDGYVYPVITGAFGSPSDLDRNGRVILLLLNIRENVSDSYTTGYFDPNDLLKDPYSNRGEILYINYKASGEGNVYSTMAHELQHLINYSLHLPNEMDTWIDEGLASAAEYLYEGKQDDQKGGRIWWFNKDPKKTIQKGNNFFIWDGSWENSKEPDDLGNYATVYLFFQWLRIHANNGSEIYRDIINSKFTDYRAVTDAAKKRIPGFSGIRNDEEVWAKLLGDWYAANRLRATDGIYGYKNEITLDFTWSYPESNTAVFLYPGEGVYSGITGAFTPPQGGGSHIRYLGLGNGSVNSSSSYRETYLLTYNYTTDVPEEEKKAPAEKGYVANMVPVMTPFSADSGSAGMTETPEAILMRWDGGRVFLEKTRSAGRRPQNF